MQRQVVLPTYADHESDVGVLKWRWPLLDGLIIVTYMYRLQSYGLQASLASFT